MLHAPSHQTVAKLDISRLLESSPSPRSRPAAPEIRTETHGARSASDPPPTRVPAATSKRSSVSSANSGTESYTALSASSLPGQGTIDRSGGIYPQSVQQQQHRRPRIPSLSTLPLPQPLLAAYDNQNQPEPRPHAHSNSSSSHYASNLSYSQALKRPAPQEHASAPPAKRQSKWTAEEDALVIELRGAGMKWEDISKRIPGRTPLSCRLHYQNYIERRSQWDEDRKNRLARLYERLKPEMWKPLAAELNVPWRAAEAMHWQLGQVEMARRAGVTPFSISSTSSAGPLGSRPEIGAVETSPTGAYPGGSYPTSGYNTINYPPQSVRSEYFEERGQAYRGASQSRTRSVSTGSGHDQISNTTGYSSTGWTQTAPLTPAGRHKSDAWTLPRLPEVEVVQPSSGQPERGHSSGKSNMNLPP